MRPASVASRHDGVEADELVIAHAHHHQQAAGAEVLLGQQHAHGGGQQRELHDVEAGHPAQVQQRIGAVVFDQHGRRRSAPPRRPARSRATAWSTTPCGPAPAPPHSSAMPGASSEKVRKSSGSKASTVGWRQRQQAAQARHNRLRPSSKANRCWMSPWPAAAARSHAPAAAPVATGRCPAPCRRGAPWPAATASRRTGRSWTGRCRRCRRCHAAQLQRIAVRNSCSRLTTAKAGRKMRANTPTPNCCLNLISSMLVQTFVIE
jgi:hypothetical protein